jgi:hypothetical protein
LHLDPTIQDRKVLLLWFAKDRAEIAVWDHGLRVDGCSIQSQRMLSSNRFQSSPTGSFEALPPPSDDLLKDAMVAVERLLVAEQNQIKPIERVMCSGFLGRDRARKHALHVGLAPRVLVTCGDETPDCNSSAPGREAADKSGLVADSFDEALGAIIPELCRPASSVVSWRRRSARAHRFIQIQRRAMGRVAERAV